MVLVVYYYAHIYSNPDELPGNEENEQQVWPIWISTVDSIC